jgi:hypothetical protein
VNCNYPVKAAESYSSSSNVPSGELFQIPGQDSERALGGVIAEARATTKGGALYGLEEATNV